MPIRLHSIQIGQIQTFQPDTPRSQPWSSGIAKWSVDGPIQVGKQNLDGDRQADLVHHGGRDKAVLAYSLEHYESWQREFPEIDWEPGSFGENLTLAGTSETQVCIGDIFRIGYSLLQISQPRQPCWKLARRWGLSKLPVRVQQSGNTGWYLRVLEEGFIEKGQVMKLENRPHPEWTVARANGVMYARPRNSGLEQELAACDALSEAWKKVFFDRCDSSRVSF